MQVVKGKGKKRVAKKAEPVWPTVVTLNDEEQAVFNRMRDHMLSEKTWKVSYTEQLAHYVRCMSISAAASDRITTDGIIQKFRNGVTQVSPGVSAYFKSVAALFTLSGHFGFTPKANESVTPSKQGDLFEDLPNPMAKRK